MSHSPPITVLLVDPSTHIQDSIPNQLDIAGFHVLSATNAKDSSLTLSASKVDIIILETELPDMKGLEFLKQLREKGIWTFVLILSNQNSVLDRIAGLDAGGDDFLPKPFHMTELISRLNAISRSL